MERNTLTTEEIIKEEKGLKTIGRIQSEPYNSLLLCSERRIHTLTEITISGISELKDG